MSIAVASPPLITAEEFERRPDPGHPEELVRGRIIVMPPPTFRHGEICAEAAFHIRLYLASNPIGRVTTNDSGVVTEREPDSGRGPDVAYYSLERVPKDTTISGYSPVSPELVVEIRSPGNSWKELHKKVSEYLDAGVLHVLILDPTVELAYLFGEEGPRTLGVDEELTFPALLPGFAVRVGLLFP